MEKHARKRARLQPLFCLLEVADAQFSKPIKKGADLRRPLNLFSLVDSYIFTFNEALCKCRMWRPAPARSS